MVKKKEKWKWDEYSQWKEQKSQPEPDENPVRVGQCAKCRSGSFNLKINHGKMDRICKGCGHIVENV